MSNKVKGGLADGMSLKDICKKHNVKFDDLKSEFKKGVKVELEHTKNIEVAKEIAKDHLVEDPKYYSKLQKMETNEVTGADASGSFSAPISGTGPIKKIDKLHNFTLKENIEFKDLLGKTYKYAYGSGYEKNIEPNTYEWIKGRLKEMMRFYLFDFEFYHNWLQDDSLKKEYWRGFDKFTENMVIDDELGELDSNILSKFFILDKDKGEVRWRLNDKVSKSKKVQIIKGRIFSNELKDEYKKFVRHNKEGDVNEVTDASSSGAYDVPFGGGPKGRKNPLKIGGVNSIKNSRAVKDKNFPKWGGPDAVFVSVKEKCKKFPYCNQGDIKSLEFFENKELNEAIDKYSKKHNVSKELIESLVLSEIKKYLL